MDHLVRRLGCTRGLKEQNEDIIRFQFSSLGGLQELRRLDGQTLFCDSEAFMPGGQATHRPAGLTCPGASVCVGLLLATCQMMHAEHVRVRAGGCKGLAPAARH